MSILNIFDIPAGEEQQDVADDGDDYKWVEAHSNATGTFSSAHCHFIDTILTKTTRVCALQRAFLN